MNNYYMESGRSLFEPRAPQPNMLFLSNRHSVFPGFENSLKRKHFLYGRNDVFEEDYYDDQLPEKNRRLTPEQVVMLEKSFEAENKLEPERKAELAKKLGLQPRQIAVWFQNRRARWKTKQLETDYVLLKASYDSLLANCDSLLKENDSLKTQMVSLMGKLQETKEKMTNESILIMGVETGGVGSGIQGKVEDRVSSGSIGSAVVDENDGLQLLLDSGNSYFAPNDELNYGSDDGCSLFDVFAPVDVDQQPEAEEGETGNWWVWS